MIKEVLGITYGIDKNKNPEVVKNNLVKNNLAAMERSIWLKFYPEGPDWGDEGRYTSITQFAKQLSMAYDVELTLKYHLILARSTELYNIH